MNSVLHSLALRSLYVLLFACCSFTLTAQDTLSTLPFGVYLEAECAQVGSAWLQQRDSLASDSTYVVIKPGLTSLDTVPPDVDSNQVRFTLTVQERDSFRLWARVQASSPDADSYWVRVNGGQWIKWLNRLRVNGQWIWREVAGSPFFAEAGEVTIDFSYREADTRLDKIYFTSLRASPQGTTAAAINCADTTDQTAVYFEAECGEIGDDYIYRVDTEVSNSGYVLAKQPSTTQVPTETDLPGQIKYTVQVDSAGTYYMYARMATPDLGKNSFFVKVDDNDWVDYNSELGGGDLAATGFEWKQVNNMGDTLALDLDAGSHIIYIAKREAGTQLDKFALSQDTMPPAGFGGVSLNCLPNAITPTRAPLDLNSAVDVFPNPVNGQLNVRLTSAAVSGRVQLQVMDMTGRMLSNQVYEKASTELRAEVGVDHLAPGLYRILLTSEQGIVSRPFIKQ